MTVLKSKASVHEEVREAFGAVPEWLQEMPEGAQNGFWEIMRDFQLTETQIPNKYKELIGLAVAAATHCKYCTYFHAEAARLFGATEDEIAEASMAAGLTMAASTFITGQQIDYDTFRRETSEIIDYVQSQASQKAGPPKQKPPRARA